MVRSDSARRRLIWVLQRPRRGISAQLPAPQPGIRRAALEHTRSKPRSGLKKTLPLSPSLYNIIRKITTMFSKVMIKSLVLSKYLFEISAQSVP